MSLPNLIAPPPGQAGWREYWFNHFQDHLDILAGVYSSSKHIAAIVVTAGGSGYVAPVVTLLGDGTGATAGATLSGGVITGITVDTQGVNYTYATVSITDGSGSGATADAIVNLVQLTEYVIDPWRDEDKDGILERHQQYHNDMNALYNLAGNDLSEVDLKKEDEKKAWVWLNYGEHLNIHQKLGL